MKIHIGSYKICPSIMSDNCSSLYSSPTFRALNSRFFPRKLWSISSEASRLTRVETTLNCPTQKGVFTYRYWSHVTGFFSTPLPPFSRCSTTSFENRNIALFSSSSSSTKHWNLPALSVQNKYSEIFADLIFPTGFLPFWLIFLFPILCYQCWNKLSSYPHTIHKRQL